VGNFAGCRDGCIEGSAVTCDVGIKVGRSDGWMNG
jgi:hypothetical protein